MELYEVGSEEEEVRNKKMILVGVFTHFFPFKSIEIKMKFCSYYLNA